MNTSFKYVIRLDLLTLMQTFVAIQSAVLKKMMLEIVIFGNFRENFGTEIVTFTISYRQPDVTLNSYTY